MRQSSLLKTLGLRPITLILSAQNYPRGQFQAMSRFASRVTPVFLIKSFAARQMPWLRPIKLILS
ncbi:MAG TPA: hypothetical protein VIC51_10335, partial [Psychromonas sp.]